MVEDPFLALAPSVQDAVTGVRIWYTSPPGALVRLAPGTFLDVDVATRLTSTTDLRGRFPDQRLRYVLDFRDATGYSTAARQLINGWGAAERELIARLTFVSPTSPVFRMGIATLMLGLQQSGLQVELIESLDALLARRELQPAV
jgi:hypothetical protein